MAAQVSACLVLLLLAALATGTAARQSASERAEWNQPVPPFHLAGNIYYVGAKGVSAFLVVSPAGSALLDGGLPETAPQIARNIAALGFRVADVKYLLNSHAHFDHAGGLAELKRLSGATLVASAGDAPTLRAGGPNQPSVAVDRIIGDGDTVRVGDITLTAMLTPGHTKGCTTWTTTTTDHDRALRVVFYCSTSVVEPLVGNQRYPGIVADYQRTFERLRALEADVFLAPHPDFFAMDAKRSKAAAGGSNPFVEPAELHRFVESSARQFRAALEKQQRAGARRRRGVASP